MAEGRLVGGNLAIIASMCGTRYQLDSRGCVLFLEDVGEPAYRLDRMLLQPWGGATGRYPINGEREAGRERGRAG